MNICMQRREFIAALGGAAAWPLAARAAMPMVGLIYGGSAAESADRVRAFRKFDRRGPYFPAHFGGGALKTPQHSPRPGRNP
jgi:hypothetical protein